jgi:hypothetical protein
MRMDVASWAEFRVALHNQRAERAAVPAARKREAGASRHIAAVKAPEPKAAGAMTRLPAALRTIALSGGIARRPRSINLLCTSGVSRAVSESENGMSGDALHDMAARWACAAARVRALAARPQIANTAANLLHRTQGHARRLAGALRGTAAMTSNLVRLAALLPALALAGVALTGCETTGGGAPGPVAAAPQEPMTHSRAAMECWMGTEKSDARMNLDKRADVVDRCIREKLKNAPPPNG